MRFYIVVLWHIVPTYRAYRLYIRQVMLTASMLYRRRRAAHTLWAREYLVRKYLEKHHIGFWAYVRRIRGR